jgi:hypothetical protein
VTVTVQRPASRVFYKRWRREDEEQLLVNTRLIYFEECGVFDCPFDWLANAGWARPKLEKRTLTVVPVVPAPPGSQSSRLQNAVAGLGSPLE